MSTPEILIWKKPPEKEAGKPLTLHELHCLPVLDFRKSGELKVLFSRLISLMHALESSEPEKKDSREHREWRTLLSETEGKMEEIEDILRERKEMGC